jgi:hypothetical protein
MQPPCWRDFAGLGCSAGCACVGVKHCKHFRHFCVLPAGHGVCPMNSSKLQATFRFPTCRSGMSTGGSRPTCSPSATYVQFSSVPYLQLVLNTMVIAHVPGVSLEVADFGLRLYWLYAALLRVGHAECVRQPMQNMFVCFAVLALRPSIHAGAFRAARM